MKVDVFVVRAKGHPDDKYSESYLQDKLKGVAVVHYVTPGFKLVIHKNRKFKGSNTKFKETVKNRLKRTSYLLQYITIDYKGKKLNHKYVI